VKSFSKTKVYRDMVHKFMV